METQPVDKALSALDSNNSPIENIEDTRSHVTGVSVQFAPEVSGYEEATEYLDQQLSGVVDVENYSNMTGEGDSQVIILIEL